MNVKDGSDLGNLQDTLEPQAQVEWPSRKTHRRIQEPWAGVHLMDYPLNQEQDKLENRHYLGILSTLS